jgi:putative methionine-R-sulfoxide reductase with GAF domain
MQANASAPAVLAPRNLALRFIFGLVLIHALLIGGQVLIQLGAQQQTADATLIDRASRQQMMSQRLSKAALESLAAGTQEDRDAALAEVQTIIGEWEQTQRGLLYGDTELGLPANTNAEVARLLTEIAPNFESMYSAGVCLVPREAERPEGCDLGRTIYAQLILANESGYLNGMDAVTAAYVAEANARTISNQLLNFGLFLAALATLAAIGLFLVRPLTRRVTETITELIESRQQLTQALHEADARSRDLQTVADVNLQVATILDPRRLLQDVVDLTKERFALYHAHIYLLNQSGDTLQLTAGAGHVGREMVAQKRQIALENMQSIVATAGRDRRGVIINDTQASPTFLPHPLLPNTRSEMAVPLIARGQLLGVLDVQSDQLDYFTAQVLETFELMASQISTAISNTRLYDDADRTSRHDRAITEIDRRIQGALGVDEIIQTTVKELGKALRVPYTAIELKLPPQNGDHAETAKER